MAETRLQAKDAAELIEVDYDPLPAVADTAKALQPGQPQVHPEAPGNLAFDWHYGDEAKTKAAFASAARTVRLDLINNKVICNAMEPRACVAEPDAANDRLTLHVCTQGGWGFRDILAQNLGLEADKVRVLTPDVGGGFGMKGFYYPEYTMAGFAARKLNRPVKWTGERGESFLSDTMGRDHVTKAELAFDASNRITALRVNVISNMGAYYYQYAPYIPTLAALKVLPGVYAIPTLSYSVQGVFTNTVPVDAYRGAGRPESIYCMERVIEAAARELGVDVTELQADQLHQARADALQHGRRRDLRHGRVRPGHGHRHAASRLAGCRRAQAGGRQPRQVSRHRHVLLHRIDHGRSRPSTPPSASSRTARSRSWSAPRPTARATTRPTRRCSTSASACRSSRSASSRATPTRSRPVAAPAARARSPRRGSRSTVLPTP